MPWLGLIGGIILAFIGTLFGAWDAGTTVPAITVIPEFLWELSLGPGVPVRRVGQGRYRYSMSG